MQTTLPEKRVRKKKRMPGEVLDDEPVASSDAAFEVNVHNVILDTVAGNMDRRFSANAKLASDFACLDPKNFPEIKINGLPNSALQEISKCPKFPLGLIKYPSIYLSIYLSIYV